jgi:hypothetical protein
MFDGVSATVDGRRVIAMGRTARNFLIAWLTGMVFGLAATERWRRLGLRAMPVDVPQAGTAIVDSPPTDELVTGGTTGTFRSRVATPVAAGVKADVVRLKTAVGRVANHNGSSAPTPVDEELTPGPERC